MKNHTKLALFLLPLLPVALSAATVVNVDFSRDETGPLGGNADVLFNATAAAPDSGTIWNEYDISLTGAGSTIPVGYQVDDLVDSLGVATTVDLELTSGWYRAFNSALTGNNLQREWIFANNPSVGVATLKGLNPATTYDLYLIAATRDTLFTIGNTTKLATAGVNANIAGWADGVEYVVFQSLTPDSNGQLVFNLAGNTGETAGELAGLQLVAVPEPSTALLVLGALAGFVLRRRR